MTIMGQLYDMEVNYVYEESQELIRVGKLPINFDWSIVSYYSYYIHQNKIQGSRLTDLEQEIMIDLVELGVFRKGETNFKRTLIGDLFANFMESEHSAADNSLGFIMEYKVYEYLINFGKPAISIKHSVRPFKREIDLLVEYEDRTYMVGEVKSYDQVLNAFSQRSKDREGKVKNLSTQIGSQIDEFLENGFYPNEYILFIHKQYYFGINPILQNLKLLREFVENKTGKKTRFEARFFNLDFTLRDRDFFKNPYSKIGSLVLKDGAIKTINF
jgi:small nuclear ribonucleoprotein (snRNP)-like protein